jgi:hypothetical protein
MQRVREPRVPKREAEFVDAEADEMLGAKLAKRELRGSALVAVTKRMEREYSDEEEEQEAENSRGPPRHVAPGMRGLRKANAAARDALLSLLVMGYYGEPLDVHRARRSLGVRKETLRARRDTDASVQCAAGCGKPVFVNFVAYHADPAALPYKICDAACSVPTAAHKQCLANHLRETGASHVCFTCKTGDCNGTVEFRRRFALKPREWGLSGRRLFAWIYSHLFFWPFIFFWPVLFFLWLAALYRHYEAPKKNPHPGLPFLANFTAEEPDLDIYFCSAIWWHRWVAAIIGYSMWTLARWVLTRGVPERVKRLVYGVMYNYE